MLWKRRIYAAGSGMPDPTDVQGASQVGDVKDVLKWLKSSDQPEPFNDPPDIKAAPSTEP